MAATTIASLLIALVAVTVAVVTVQTRPAGSSAAAPTPSESPAPPAPTDQPTGMPVPTPTYDGLDTGSAPVDPTDTLPEPTNTASVAPVGDYVLAYESRRMTVPCQARVDLDQPRVAVSAAFDFGYCQSTLNEVPLINTPLPHATLRSAGATPKECQETIQLAPTTGAFPSKAGLVFCQVTDGVQSVPGGGSSPKTCIVVITSIDPERRLNLTATCYTNPT